MKTSALVLVFALAGHEPLAAATFLFEQSERRAVGVPVNECRVPNVVGSDRAAAERALAQYDIAVVWESRRSRRPQGTVIEQRCESSGEGPRVVLVQSSGSTSDGEPEGKPEGRPERPRSSGSSGGSSVGTAIAVGAAAAIIGAAIIAKRKKAETPTPEPAAPPPEAPAAPPPEAPAAPVAPLPEPPAPPDPPRSPDRSAIVPLVTNLPVAEAHAAIMDAQLRPLTQNAADKQDPLAIVESQVPAAGTRVVPGATVAVAVGVPAPAAPAVVPEQAPAPPPVQPTPAPLQQRPAPAPVRPIGIAPVAPPAVDIATPAPIPSQRLPIGNAAPFATVSLPPVPVADPAWPLWPWILLLIALLVASTRWVRRKRPAAAVVETPPPTPPVAYTFIPRLDPGRQVVTSAGRSRTLEFAIQFGVGAQRLRQRSPGSRIGALS